MRRKSIREYFPENKELEDIILNCSDNREVFEKVKQSNYAKSILDPNIKIESKNLDGKHKNFLITLKTDVFIYLGIPFLEGDMLSSIHKNDSVEVIMVYEGEILIQVHGDKLKLKTGDICRIYPYTDHKILSSSKDDIFLVFNFSKTFMNYVLECENKNKEINNWFNKEKESLNGKVGYILSRRVFNKDIDNTLIEIINEYKNKKIGYEEVIYGYFTRIIFQASCKNMDEESVEKNINVYSKLWIKIKSLIEDNIKFISKEFLVKELNLSSKEIEDVIYEHVGITLNKFITIKKMEFALDLLRNSDLSINKIIKEVGYINKTYFYKVFEEKYGLKPSEVRNLNK